MENRVVTPMVIVKFDFNTQHFRRAMWENFTTSDLVRRINFSLFVLGVLLCLFLVQLNSKETITESQLYFYCKIIIIVFTAGFILEIALLWNYIRKLALRPSYQRNFGEVEFKFSEDGFEAASIVGEGKSRWEVIDKIRFSKRFMFLTLYNGTFIPLPRNTENEESLQKIKILYDIHTSK